MKLTRAVIRKIEENPEHFASQLTLRELKELLIHLDYEYHDLNAERVSNEAYDILREVYNGRAKRPYARVGHRSSHRERDVKLPVKMGSLTKAKVGSRELDKLIAKGGPYVISDKEDGISLELIYENYTLVHCYQRGDGSIGTETDGIIESLNCPKRISTKNLIVRVEFTVNNSTFDRYMSKKAGTGTFQTARNGVAGLANRNKPNPQISKVKVMAHEILKGKGSNLAPSEQYKELKRLGFTPVPYKVYDRIDGDMLTRLLATRKKKARREIDGLVVALDKPYKRVNGNPDHMFAFKVNDKENSVVVTVKEVEWNQSRYGKLPPRVIIPPTTIGGVTVTYATGHNAFFIDHGYKSTEKNPPYSPRPINKGAKVRILRSGDVIPQIIEVVKASPTPSTPDVAHKRKGVNYYAVDKSDDKTVRAYTFFFSTLKIDGIKSGTIVDLMNRGFMHLEDIVYAEMEDFRDVGLTAATASKLARNIKAGIENADVATLAVASGVFGSGIGDSKLRPIFEAKPNAYMLKEPAIHKLLESMPGYKTTIPQICAGMIKYRKWLKDMGIKPMPPKKAEVTGNKMKGKNVLFTSVRDEELKKWIIANGGKVVSSVGQANLLIVKNMDASNKKTDYANANGIPIITVADFREEMM